MLRSEILAWSSIKLPKEIIEIGDFIRWKHSSHVFENYPKETLYLICWLLSSHCRPATKAESCMLRLLVLRAMDWDAGRPPFGISLPLALFADSELDYLLRRFVRWHSDWLEDGCPRENSTLFDRLVKT